MSLLEFKIGDKVYAKDWGIGIIINIIECPELAYVEFDVNGHKYHSWFYFYDIEKTDMSNKITIEIDPLSCVDLLTTCEFIIDKKKNYIEYLTERMNHKDNNYGEKINIANKQLDIIIDTKETIEKAYNDYLGLNTKEEGD